MTPKPVRLQYSRKKGAHLVSPNDLPIVCVDRRSKWGNPFHIGDGFPYQHSAPLTRQDCVEVFESYLRENLFAFRVEDVKRELRDKNLACQCKLGEMCHADVLLRIANE